MKLLFRTSAWLALVCFTAIILRNSLPYFGHGPQPHAFIAEKAPLDKNPLWLAALIVHVAAGVVCLASSFLQFFRPVLKRLPALHRWLGRLYAISVLGFLTPTGFYLACHAHGGLAGTLGFLLLGVLTAGTTWKGWTAMQHGRLREHIAWMIRSMAMTTTAITFRIEHVLFQELGLHPEMGFLAALYLSIAGNALAAEWLLHRMRHPRRRRAQTHKPKIQETYENDPPLPASARARFG